MALTSGKPLIALAVAQTLTMLCLPQRWSAVPLGLVIGFAAIRLIDYLVSAPKNPSLLDQIVPGRVTAQLPLSDGSFDTSPSSGQLVVFNLGVQFNHPLGRLCPGGKEIADRFIAMHRDLMRRRDELGILSQSDWDGRVGEKTRDNMLLSFYFRDVESLHRFAHEELHREAWNWYYGAKVDHIGIFHETYVVQPHAYETVYANCRPVMLGSGVVKDADGRWRNTLVSADQPSLKSQWGRMRRDKDGVPMD